MNIGDFFKVWKATTWCWKVHACEYRPKMTSACSLWNCSLGELQETVYWYPCGSFDLWVQISCTYNVQKIWFNVVRTKYMGEIMYLICGTEFVSAITWVPQHLICILAFGKNEQMSQMNKEIWERELRSLLLRLAWIEDLSFQDPIQRSYGHQRRLRVSYLMVSLFAKFAMLNLAKLYSFLCNPEKLGVLSGACQIPLLCMLPFSN